MILGIDTGISTFGWARLDEERQTFIDLGVVVQPKQGKARTASLERARRANTLADVLAEKAPGCSLIVVEQMSFGMPGALAKVSIGMSWGIVLGVAATMQPPPRLITIAPQRWQRQVLVHSGKRVDQDKLARVAAAHIVKYHPHAAKQLRAIPKKQRVHALDAAMIALCGALRRDKCDEVRAAARGAE